MYIIWKIEQLEKIILIEILLSKLNQRHYNGTNKQIYIHAECRLLAQMWSVILVMPWLTFSFYHILRLAFANNRECQVLEQTPLASDPHRRWVLEHLGRWFGILWRKYNCQNEYCLILAVLGRCSKKLEIYYKGFAIDSQDVAMQICQIFYVWWNVKAHKCYSRTFSIQ